MSSFTEMKNNQMHNTSHSWSRQKSWVYEPESLISGTVSYLVKYIGNAPVQQTEDYEVVKEACRKIQHSNKNKKPVNVRIIISTAEIILQSKRSDLHFAMDDVTYSQQYYQARKESGTETDKIFAFIGKSSKNGTTSCYLFQSNDHAKVVDLTIKQAKEIDLANKPSRHYEGSDMNGYLSDDESLNSSLETASMTTSEEDASMKSSQDMDSITSDDEINYNETDRQVNALILAEQMRKYYFDQSIKNQVYVHDRSKTTQSGRYERSFGPHSPPTSSRTPSYSFGPSNPYMLHGNQVPYQNIPAPPTLSNFNHQSNEAMLQNYFTQNQTHLNNGEYETSRNSVDGYYSNYENSQNDNYNTAGYNSYQHLSSQMPVSPTARKEQYPSMLKRQESRMENYNQQLKQENCFHQRRNMENYNQQQKQTSNMENYIQTSKMENFTQKSNIENYTQGSNMENIKQRSNSYSYIQPKKQFTRQMSNIEDYSYIRLNKERNNMDDYMEANQQRNQMEDYLKSNKATSQDGSMSINNVWATWAGFSRPVVSFGYGSFSMDDKQEELVRPRSY